MNKEKLSVENLDILMRKYDRPGPRYTCYPTAPIFSKEFGHEKFVEEISKTNRSDVSTDLSLYIHIPFCDSLCCFCGRTTSITKNRERIREYLVYLKKEIDLLSSYISSQRKVVQMYWGGETPTYLEPAEISEITSYIKEKFRSNSEAEVSAEIDPRGLVSEHLQAL